MKRSVINAAAAGALCLVLVTGCGRGVRHERSGDQRGGAVPAGVSSPSSAPGGSGGTPAPTGTDPAPQLDDVDRLLGQLDSQLNSDNASPSDAD
jgi:hypothetical protein